MTHHRIKVEPDGTRVYSNGVRYRPLSPEQRTYAVRKPDVPGAVRYHGKWYVPLPVLPAEARVMPATRPDEEAYEHMNRTAMCMCEVCRRPAAERWRRKWRREH